MQSALKFPLRSVVLPLDTKRQMRMRKIIETNLQIEETRRENESTQKDEKRNSKAEFPICMEKAGILTEDACRFLLLSETLFRIISGLLSELPQFL